MKAPIGGLFAKFCDENGNLSVELLAEFHERDAKQQQLDELELEVLRLYNASDFSSLN
jgi:hypothetical protein